MSVKFGAETVKQVADLARLRLSESEVARFSGQLADVLSYVEKLGEVDTKGVEPLTHALDLQPATRPDEQRPSPGAETMLGAAPEHLHDGFKVPQVMGGS
jgi:aspartyl-tRNA(Asn)/glutamyl-tRNA(Gln) amidotransferase subunit C